MIHGIDTSFLIASELVSHSRHTDARQLLESLNEAGDRFAFTPLVLAEFIHIVTDSRRCTQPLTIDVALNRAEQLWNATETVQMFQSDVAVVKFI